MALKKSKAEYFMRQAIDVACRGIKKGQTPFGACIIKNNKVVSLAHNIVWQTTDISAHAEINAIRQACRKLRTIDLSDCIIFSTCEPCPMCFSACHWARISEIYYGTNIQDAKKCGFNELSVSNILLRKIGKSPIKIYKNFLRQEALKPFNMWLNQENPRGY